MKIPHKPTLEELIESTPGLRLEGHLLRGDEVSIAAIEKRLAQIANSPLYTPYYKEIVGAFLREKLEEKRARDGN